MPPRGGGVALRGGGPGWHLKIEPASGECLAVPYKHIIPLVASRGTIEIRGMVERVSIALRHTAPYKHTF